jgi:Ser/Thr protein kinase RdoA (MazF antagonist)
MRGACAPRIGPDHRRALAGRRNAACRVARVAIVHVVRGFGELSEQGRARRLRPLALAALQAYDLQVAGLRLIDNGWNCVFRVETPDGPLALRISRDTPERTPRSVASEVTFISALTAGTDVQVPRIIPNRAGELVTIAESDGVPQARPCVVFGWLRGSLLAEHVTAQHWRALGTLMARLHRFASEWSAPAGFEIPVYDSVLPYGEPLVMFEPGRADLHGASYLLQDAYHRTHERIRELDHHRPRIVVHGDLHGWNVKVQHGVLSPFDFEDLLWAVPILDVATSLYYVRDRPDYLSLAVAFRSGYETQRPWVEQEPGELDRLLVARGLDLLNTALIDPHLDIDDWPAFIRRRERLARIALGEERALVIPHAVHPDGTPAGRASGEGGSDRPAIEAI